VLNIGSAVAAFVAASFWYQSAKIKAPSELSGQTGYGGPTTIDAKPLEAFAQEVGRLNKHAAWLTAVAATLMGAATVVQQFAPHS
jgi:hypothetical protein